jgi:hypothetical protein
MDEKLRETRARNPYAPPGAPVTDASDFKAREPRPLQVTWAVRLLWVDLALSVPQVGLGWSGDRGFLLNLLTAGMSVVLLAFEAWVILKISAGRNWARWVALVSVVVGVPTAFITVGQMQEVSSFEVVLDLAATCVDGIALYLLFISSGRQWFRRRVA